MAYAKPPRFCRRCGADSKDGHIISFRGYCRPCGINIVAENIEQMSNKEGKAYDDWRKKRRAGMLRELQQEEP